MRKTHVWSCLLFSVMLPLATIGCKKGANNPGTSRVSSARQRAFERFGEQFTDHYRDCFAAQSSSPDTRLDFHCMTGRLSDLDTLADTLRESEDFAALPKNVRERLVHDSSVPLLDKRYVLAPPDGWSRDDVFTLKIVEARRNIENESEASYVYLLFGFQNERWQVLSCVEYRDGSYKSIEGSMLETLQTIAKQARDDGMKEETGSE